MKSVAEILEGIRPEVDYASSDDFFEDDLLDSVDVIQLVAALDDNFNISINPEDIVPEHFCNTVAIESLVKTYLKEGHA